ncbi:roadblock/LC7 domain-containing protein [Streptomyces sp. YC504]|uniref:Roadblock/LC7 domain-containing protein n=1 Tax=Streptomyces mesophilus TaxID=1775132 RepID=A0A6G4XAL4_9ACTN|nr:roadblock/LC7 domain-containing protein [Streptomyces mesophilus]NGO74579.1 roadblock/LC7 domain-containing protein [Streptomyces mesophilus]
MTGATPSSGELTWLMDELTKRVPEIREALVLSSDGLAMAVSSGVRREDAERFAAIASGFHSLAKGAGHHFEAGPVVQTVVELGEGFLFVVSAGRSSCLAVFATAAADVGLVAYEMARLVQRVGEHLGTGVRGSSGAT